MEEIWKQIKDFEGVYEVSNTGRVRSLDKINEETRMGTLTNVRHKGKVLTPIMSSNGYYYINLSGIKNPVYIHRLVLETFLPEVEGKTLCNHKDGDKTNNHVDNLEWCDYSDNLNHAYKTDLRKPACLGKWGKEHHSHKKGAVISPTGEIFEFEGLLEFCREKSISAKCLSRVLRGERDHHKGWRALSYEKS